MFSIPTQMKNLTLTTLALAAAALLANPAVAQLSQPAASPIQYVLCIDGIKGPGVGSDFPGCIEVSALGLSVGREMKSLAEKGGTEDINIGVGELSPVSIRKGSDGVSPLLFSYAVNGNSMGNAEIFVLEERVGWQAPLTILEVKLARSFVQAMRLGQGDLVESIDLYFNKIQLTSFERDANGGLIDSSERCWDTIKNTGCSL